MENNAQLVQNNLATENEPLDLVRSDIYQIKTLFYLLILGWLVDIFSYFIFSNMCNITPLLCSLAIFSFGGIYLFIYLLFRRRYLATRKWIASFAITMLVGYVLSGGITLLIGGLFGLCGG